MRNYLRGRYWRDTKSVAKSLGVSNASIINLLEQEGFTYRDKQGNKKAHARAKDLVRHAEKSWQFYQDNRGKTQQKHYTVLQLTPEGIGFVRRRLHMNEKQIA